MTPVNFTCPSCRSSFSLAAERIPAAGARGRCQRCGTTLVVFPDGRASRADAPFVSGPQVLKQQTVRTAPASAASHEPIWEIRKHDPDQDFDQGPFTIGQLREKIVDGQLIESDLARVHEGEWAPARSYPALAALFTEAIHIHRQRHGDEEHCAVHYETKPRWRCEKCQDYLCEECVKNEPLIEGGAPRYLCRSCGGDAAVIAKRKGGLKGLVGGIWKR